MNLKRIFGRNVKYFRYRKHFTQAELAEKLEMSTNHLGYIERGVYGTEFETIDKMCTIFNIRPYELFLQSNNIKLPHRVDMQ